MKKNIKYQFINKSEKKNIK